ncbi:TonB-dependent receptor domain-containing protein [Vaginella massiliensis]|uniref:TonB-dependent receptor domain-containing protein n=1 Tax=Vaginella massiliensis TaxID=1816680 RepID=UPI0008390D0D|nr:TonB-dependent receptor [Vaginella massiliensis]
MSLKNLGLMILSLFTINVLAQNDIKVTGQVTDSESEQAIQYASVMVENDTDGFIGEAITDENGNFSIETPNGNLVFIFEALGYTSAEKTFNIQETNTNLGKIALEKEAVIALLGATIVAEKPIYKVELDKKVYDMANDPMSQGLSLSDALSNVPSVEVDAEGNVSLRGNENVKFLVDGKPSGMLGISDPAEALKNIPAENVERIEVITNPSSRYEASGSAGIINIVLKKGANTGFNGSITANGGIPEMLGINANLNYKTRKFNWFTNLGWRYTNREGENSAFETSYVPGGNNRATNRNSERIRRNYNIRLGTEYYIDDFNTIGLSAGYRYNNGNNYSSIIYENFDQQMNFLSREGRHQSEKELENNFDLDLNYKHEFDKKGHEFSFTGRFSYQKEDEDGFIFTDRLNGLNEQELSLEKQTTAVFTADYVRPIGEKGKFEAGLRSDFADTKTDSKNHIINTDGSLTPNERYFANVDNQQNIFAAYTQYGNAIGNFQYFLGARVEHSDINIENFTLNNKIKKSYTDFFPSATLNYSFTDKNQIQLSYSRRIRRPMGFMLMPFFNSTDDRNIRYGNPDLNPTYTNSLELSYITNIGRLMITPSIFYQKTTDMINQFQRRGNVFSGDKNMPTTQSPNPETDFQSIYITRPVNAGEEDKYGLDLTATYRPFRWWNLMMNVNLFGYKRSGTWTEVNNDYVNPNTYHPALNNLESITDSQDFSGDGFSMRGRLSSNFTLPKDFKTQLAVSYRGPMETKQQKIEDNLSMDFSLSKDILNGNGTISFNIRDVFDSRKREVTTYYRDDAGNLTSSNFNSMRWSVRSFNLSFTYRIKSTRDHDQRQRQDGDEMMGGEEMMAASAG